ncbi:MAG: hypothetical protein QMB65_11680 [Vicingaceae bacterium]|jgi:hypothetical protein
MALLKLKTWKVFILLIFSFVLTLIASIFDVSINGWSTVQMGGFIRIIGLFIFTQWLFIVGLELNRVDNNSYKFNTIILAIASICFFIGYASLNLALFPKLDSMTPLFIKILSMPITFFGIAYLFYNIPMSLKSIELKRKARYSECLLDALLFFSCAMGIGIWWLQPRMNSI